PARMFAVTRNAPQSSPRGRTPATGLTGSPDTSMACETNLSRNAPRHETVKTLRYGARFNPGEKHHAKAHRAPALPDRRPCRHDFHIGLRSPTNRPVFQ